MNIYEKIEEIRQKPEHIKMRYVWGSVAVSMIFIIIIWIFSWQTATPKKKTVDDSLGKLKNDFKELNKSTNDLKNVDQSLQSALENISQSQPQNEIQE